MKFYRGCIIGISSLIELSCGRTIFFFGDQLLGFQKNVALNIYWINLKVKKSTLFSCVADKFFIGRFFYYIKLYLNDVHTYILCGRVINKNKSVFVGFHQKVWLIASLILFKGSEIA